MNDEEREQKIKNLIICGYSEREAVEYVKRDEEIERNRVKPEPEELDEEEELEEEETAPTRAQIIRDVQEDVIRERKLEILDKIEKSLEESEKEDGELRARRVEVFEAELKRSIFWNSILENKSWEPLLKDIVKFINAQTRGKIPRLVITFENDGKTMHIDKVFLDRNGQRIIHELTDNILGENEE